MEFGAFCWKSGKKACSHTGDNAQAWARRRRKVLSPALILLPEWTQHHEFQEWNGMEEKVKVNNNNIIIYNYPLHLSRDSAFILRDGAGEDNDDNI